MCITPQGLLFAFLGGVVPALVWLLFWLLEDRCEPEPKRYIFYSFVAGMLSVGPALLLQAMAGNYLQPSYFLHLTNESPNFGLLTAWACIEEVLKFSAAYIVALRLYVFDEPIDAVVYMVTAALGFSALENAIYLLTPISEGQLFTSIALGQSRFIGASLLHTFSSATVGIALAMSFMKPASTRKLYALCGLILATVLHTAYNYLILHTTGAGIEKAQQTFWIFVCLWFGVIATLLIVERLKTPKDYC